MIDPPFQGHWVHILKHILHTLHILKVLLLSSLSSSNEQWRIGRRRDFLSPLRYKQGSHFFSDDIWNQGGCPLQQALDFTEK